MDSSQKITLDTRDGTITIYADGDSTFVEGLSSSRLMPGDSAYNDGLQAIESMLLALVAEGVTDEEALEAAVNTALDAMGNHVA